jgi:MFS family permease
MTAAGRAASPPIRLGPDQARLLRMLAVASFFEGYDLNVVMVALPAIRRSFGLTQAQASSWVALLFLGALPAVLIARQADRHGRRRLLLASITGYTSATAATALAPGIITFGICQLCARACLALEVTLTWTVLAEELPAQARGYGFGVLATLDALGAGTGALAWGLLLAPHHLSWRCLYAVATPALVAAAFIRRRLPESSRFTAAAAAGRLADGWRSLLRPPHRRNLVPLCVAAALGALLTQPFVFVADFMQTQRHLSATAASLILVGAGALAMPVLTGAGAASDRLGRKRVGCSFLALGIAGTLWFFLLARSPASLFAALAVAYIGQFGAWPTLSGFTTELFPTSQRALARSAAGAATVTGQCGSFLLAAVLLRLTGNLACTVAVLAAGPAAALATVAACLPETAGKELEETAPGLSKHARQPRG